MQRITMWLVVVCLTSCQPLEVADHRPVDPMVVREKARWSSCLLIAPDHSWKPRAGSALDLHSLPKSVEAGSATPITADGYFLTAAHVLRKNPGGVMHLKYGQHDRWYRARLVWQDPLCDLALIHVPLGTTGYFHWIPERQVIYAGARVYQVGSISGNTMVDGRMLTELRPPSILGGNRQFSHDIEISKGDSGGAVVDATGRLIGINVAVLRRMPCMRFMSSEGIRPNLGALNRIIRKDRDKSPR